MKDVINTFSLNGRRAVVTGGSRGIGAEIVRLFATAGAQVAFCHRQDDAQADEVCRSLEGRSEKAVRHADCDIGTDAGIADLCAFAKRELGEVDILVNAAGISGDIPFEKVDAAALDRVLNVNLRGTFLVTQAFFPAMRRRGWGRVINFASQLAFKGAPDMAHYCASKGGVVGFTRALARDGAPDGVTVNAIAPGPIDTDQLAGMTEEWRRMKHAELPIGRFGTVAEIAPTALLLASDAGAYFVGQTLSPNGGDVMI